MSVCLYVCMYVCIYTNNNYIKTNQLIRPYICIHAYIYTHTCLALAPCQAEVSSLAEVLASLDAEDAGPPQAPARLPGRLHGCHMHLF